MTQERGLRAEAVSAYREAGMFRKPGAQSQMQAAVRLSGSSDDEALAELRAGNQEAFGVIFERYHRLVYSTALRFLRDAGEADDLTQAVFLEVFQKLGQFDPARGTLKVWLLQFAYSRSINRRNYLMVRRLHPSGTVNDVLDETALWAASRTPDQDAPRLSRELLRELTEAQRSTIEMVFFEDLTFAEIADRRKETYSTVRHHYYRGLTRLRALISADPEPAAPHPAASASREV
jgi:RNA polymerase sigma-70 factor (ECF subfamily)